MDGPLPKWCPAVALSRQDGRHGAVALLLKAALIQVSDYRLLGASGFFFAAVHHIHGGRCDRDGMVVGFTITYPISA